MVKKVTSLDASGWPVNEVAFSYDHFGLLSVDKQEHLGPSGEATLAVQYSHADGSANHTRLNTVTYPNGRVLTYNYTSGDDSNLSRLSYLSDTDGAQLAKYTYLGLGQIVRVDYNKIGAANPTHRYNLAFGAGNDPYDGLDQFGRVVDLRWTDYAGTADLVRIKHGYDRASNRLWRRDMVSAAQTTPVYLDELYTYDGMYQLTSLQRGQLNATEDALVTNTKTFAEQWTLDPLGNWTDFKQDTDGNGSWNLDQTRSHDKANEVATIAASSTHVAYDAAGNMTTAPKPENWDDHYHFVYDPWNRLVEVWTADQQYLVRVYEYDGLNRMIAKWSYDENNFTLLEWRHYFYSDQWQVLEERVISWYDGPYSSGSVTYSGGGISGWGDHYPFPIFFQADRQFVWGIRYVDDLILRDRDLNNCGVPEERIYALQDPNWNVVALANATGAILERYSYSAYGVVRFLSPLFAPLTPNKSAYDWETLYCGYRYDYHANSALKWHIAGHRFLLSHLGRWNRRDPIGYGYEAGDTSLYRYLGNNPLNQTDPSGRFGWFTVFLIVVVVVVVVAIDAVACYAHMEEIRAKANDITSRIEAGWRECYKGPPTAGGWSPEGRPGDAIQHCIGACLANQHPWPCPGSAYVRSRIDASEGTDLDSQADLQNNQVAYGITGDCTAGCLDALKKGRLTCQDGQRLYTCPPPA